MPRSGRKDYPGAIQHVMVRGLERRRIFRDDEDCGEFLKRLAATLEATGTLCYAWALMPNHFHILIRSGEVNISKVMQVVLSGYGLYFNRRHKRSGYLYQGRFKSVLVEEETYFLSLIRYIHLNAVHGGVVKNLYALDRWKWSGHSVLMGKRKAKWQATGPVLRRFGKRIKDARRQYRQFMSEGMKSHVETGLGGLRLLRKLGGLWREEIEAKGLNRRIGQESILGDEEQVQEAIRRAKEKSSRNERLRRSGWTTQKILRRAAQAAKVDWRRLRGHGKERDLVKARALACKWLVEDLGRTTVKVGRQLRIGHATVSDCVKRGRELEKEWGIRLEGQPRAKGQIRKFGRRPL